MDISMDIDERWILAIAAVIAGFLLGSLLAVIARRALGAPGRRNALKAIATPTGTFFFWLTVIAGLVTAIGFSSPETLRPIPSDVLAWLPRVLAAGLIILAGYAGGGALSAAIATASQRAIGHRPAGLERALRWGILTTAVVVALGNIGVQTTLLQILVAGIIGTIGLTLALVAVSGGRTVASCIAASRALRPELIVGRHLTTNNLEGTITAVRPAVIHVDRGNGRTAVIPTAKLLEDEFEIDTAD
jgi:MFS family permease